MLSALSRNQATLQQTARWFCQRAFFRFKRPSDPWFVEPVCLIGVLGHRGLPMAETKQERAERIRAERDFRVRFLVRETGITEAQARDLIDLIGIDANSLLREARLLRGN
ncbi:hypothetical protein CK216_27735 [Mesorhizobium sp. WSM3876]|nr:hypothetical protein CK216_27735 [Mesorhizobium sp. WSM3876]